MNEATIWGCSIVAKITDDIEVPVPFQQPILNDDGTWNGVHPTIDLDALLTRIQDKRAECQI